MQKITPFLWFDGKAEEAAHFYMSAFPDSELVETKRYSGKLAGSQGAVISVRFRLAGLDYIALNGGPQFSFTPALSLFVSCETQAEVDGLWEALSAGGETQRCGWLKDKYGLSWQIVPRVLGELLGSPDSIASRRVMEAMLAMTKLDIAALERAGAG